MQRRTRAAWAILAGAALIAASCGGDDEGGTDTTTAATEAPGTTDAPATDDTAAPDTEAPAEELEASDIGITEDTIRIAVAISDLEAVRAAGISIPDTLTTEHLFDRWGVWAEKWNAEGGINGRQVELVMVNWDPLNPASFDSLCAAATVDDELFALVNGTGLSSVAMECVTDAGMPVMYGDVVSQDLLDSGLMVSMAPPAEVTARAGAKAWAESTDAPAGSTVGVLANNTPLISAAGNAAKEELEAAGFEVVLIETNSLAGDNAATNEEAAAAVGTFIAEGAVHAFVTTPFTENTGFWNAAAAQAGALPYTLLDTASSQCSTFGLSRAPAGAVGGQCVTAFDHPTSEGTGPREDQPFEAECRAFFDASFEDYYGGKSMPGVPAGQIITDVAGNTLISDYPPQECTIANVLYQGLMNAGVNPTRASFMEAVLNLGEVPMAGISNGEGLLSPDKPYMATAVHLIEVVGATAETAPDANGTYNGCAAPVNCGVVIGDWTSFE